jgi:hypothetical protein
MRYNTAIDKYKRKIFVKGSDLNTYEMRTGDFSLKMWSTRTLRQLIHIISVERKDREALFQRTL